MKQVDVVALIVYKKGKILVEKRKLNKKTDPGKVTIPGGHVEQGESFKEACQRELKEELRLDCQNFKFILKLLHHTEVEEQMAYYFSCEKWEGRPVCNEAEKVFWISPQQLGVLDLKVDKRAAAEFLRRKRRSTADRIS